jgi:LmbE family N-acetylglucosaminyl deacetylase
MTQKTVLVICPHADDAAAFCGGQVMLFAQDGWRVVMIRVTDDYTDSVGLSVAETIAKNTAEMHEAARIMGVSLGIELGYPTDSLSEISHGELREKFIRLFREYKPYAVLSFDPYAPFEGNRDHVVVARAVEEAFWTATFDKHHPEHLAQGLEPHSVCERWYFARQPFHANAVIDISSVIERKVDALCAHQEMMKNTINQTRLQLKTWGRYMPILDDAVLNGNIRPLLESVIKAGASELGKPHGIEFAETYRVERFGGMEAWFQHESLPLNLDEPVFTRPFFQK